MRFALAFALLAALPAQTFAQAPATVHRVTQKAFAYAPASAAAPAPLIVLLHGAGGNAREFLDQFKRTAEERRVVLLSVQSNGRTWAVRKPNEREADVANIKAAIRELTGKTPFDASRTTVLGFSDGASYALSIGMAYPSLFRTIVAFSPGYAFAPSRMDTDQRIFIAHSRRDPILPAENTREMVKGLEAAGFDPDVRWFNGGHEIDPALRNAAFDFALRDR